MSWFYLFALLDAAKINKICQTAELFTRKNAFSAILFRNNSIFSCWKVLFVVFFVPLPSDLSSAFEFNVSGSRIKVPGSMFQVQSI